MEKEQLKNLHNYVYSKYKDKIKIVFEDTTEDDFYCKLIEKKVVIPECIKNNESEWSLFAFLHEIGHVLTNTTSQKRCVQEYLATQWAIEEAKNIGFDFPRSFIYTYQNYIWKWRDKSIKLRGKNVPSKEELTITGYIR